MSQKSFEQEGFDKILMAQTPATVRTETIQNFTQCSKAEKENIRERVLKNDEINRAKLRQTTREAKRTRIGALGTLKRMDSVIRRKDEAEAEIVNRLT